MSAANVPDDLLHLTGAQFDKLLPSSTDDTQTCDGCIDGTGCKLVYLTDDDQVVYVRFEMADGSEIDLDVDLFRPRIVQGLQEQVDEHCRMELEDARERMAEEREYARAA